MVEALHRAIRTVAAMPEMVAALDRLEYAATTSDSPAAFAARIRRERDDWASVVRESGFRPEN
jgi:tripartite-type tricarboxylate transporter receptor subunit TctC